MEKLSRNDLLMINGGSLWGSIARTVLDSIYIVASVIRLIRRHG